MEKLCGNCQHWNQTRSNSSLWGLCDLTWSYDGKAKTKISLAWAEDVESYQAWLTTHANFGCVQFEARLPITDRD